MIEKKIRTLMLGSGGERSSSASSRGLVVHQAGECVAALALGWRINHIGFSPARNPDCGWVSIAVPRRRGPQHAARLAMLHVAGTAAELVVLGRFEESRCASDFRSAAAILRRAGWITESTFSFVGAEVSTIAGMAKRFDLPKALEIGSKAFRNAMSSVCQLLCFCRPALDAVTGICLDGMRAARSDSSGIEIVGKSVEGVIRGVDGTALNLRRLDSRSA